MEKEENQKQVFLFSHSPWKSPKARFPHSHSPATTARKSGNPKPGFPLSHHGFLSLTKLKKEDSPERPFPPFRLIVQLEYAVDCLKGDIPDTK
jgi:hypothetical protein